MVQQSSLSISPAVTDPSLLTSQTTTLVDNGKWHLCNSGKGLERSFKFKTFNKTWAFMNAVADECKKQRHHPEWSNVYNRVHVRWTTHSPEGLGEKDVLMAGFCDERAEEFGEMIEEQSREGGEGKADGQGLEDWRASVKDCCGLKA